MTDIPEYLRRDYAKRCTCEMAPRRNLWKEAGRICLRATIITVILYALGFVLFAFYGATCRLEGCGSDMMSQGARVIYGEPLKALGVVE